MRESMVLWSKSRILDKNGRSIRLFGFLIVAMLNAFALGCRTRNENVEVEHSVTFENHGTLDSQRKELYFNVSIDEGGKISDENRKHQLRLMGLWVLSSDKVPIYLGSSYPKAIQICNDEWFFVRQDIEKNDEVTLMNSCSIYVILKFLRTYDNFPGSRQNIDSIREFFAEKSFQFTGSDLEQLRARHVLRKAIEEIDVDEIAGMSKDEQLAQEKFLDSRIEEFTKGRPRYSNDIDRLATIIEIEVKAHEGARNNEAITFISPTDLLDDSVLNDEIVCGLYEEILKNFGGAYIGL